MRLKTGATVKLSVRPSPRLPAWFSSLPDGVSVYRGARCGAYEIRFLSMLEDDECE